MRAIAIEGFGGRARLRLVDLPTPEPGPDDVLVGVRAAGVGPWDTKVRDGLFGERSFPHVLGVEASGIVESAGENVADLREGDEVYVYSGGCYAEYVAAPAQKVAPKPVSLSFEEAAGVPVAGSAAFLGRDWGSFHGAKDALGPCRQARWAQGWWSLFVRTAASLWHV